MIGIFSSILFIFGTLFFIMFLYSLSKQRNSLSSAFALMCLAASVYIASYAFELRADSLDEIGLCLKAEYFGAPFMSAFWLFFSYRFQYNRPVPIRTSIIFMCIPVLTLFFSVTNEYHNLIYTNVSTFEYNGYLLADLSKGPWYFVNVAYAYAIQIFGMIVFYKAWHRDGARLRVQSKLMFFGSIWPMFVNLIYILGLSPAKLDLTPFGLSFSAIFFYIAIFKYGFLNMKEIVRDITFFEISEGIIVIDNKNRLLDFNEASKNIFDWADSDNIGICISEFQEGRQILDHKGNMFEIEINDNGTEKNYQFRKTILNDKNHIIGAVYFIQDITIQKEMMQKLNDIASYDSLTCIFNRRRLMEEAEKELLRSKRYGHNISILMIDIDHFKRVNDRFGHQAGDEVLKSLANECRVRLRKTDIIGRYGGEEFLIILTETDAEEAFLVAENIRNSVNDMKIESNGGLIQVTISIGIKSAVINEKEEYSIDTLISCADNALYISKNIGRNKTSISD